jgi:arsenate reductase
MEVQIFGVRKSSATRKALRFFSERRIRTHFVDLTVKPPSKGELRRFADRFGIESLLDRESPRFAERGLGAAARGEDWWLEQLTEDPLLLRLPLVREKQRLTIGDAEASWKEWVRPG